jgi:hypothetical protein
MNTPERCVRRRLRCEEIKTPRAMENQQESDDVLGEIELGR